MPSSDCTMTEPPSPPLPPLGPPLLTYFSRRKETWPLPPEPARMVMRARSTNMRKGREAVAGIAAEHARITRAGDGVQLFGCSRRGSRTLAHECDWRRVFGGAVYGAVRGERA